MLKAVLLGIALLSSSAALACAKQINAISGISKEQAQTMIIECETQKLAKINSAKLIPDEVVKKATPVMDVVTEENLNKISQIAKTAGQTVKEVAKELNVAVNDFIQTPVGMLTAGLAVWYVAGDNITTALDGLWEVLIGISLIISAIFLGDRIKKFVSKEEEETLVVPGLFGWYSKTKTVTTYKTWQRMHGDDAGWVVISWVIQAAGILVGLSIIA